MSAQFAEVAGIYSSIVYDTYYRLSIMPDSAFYLDYQISCGFGRPYSDSGTWRINDNIIYLSFYSGNKDSILIKHNGPALPWHYSQDYPIPAIDLVKSDSSILGTGIYKRIGNYHYNGKMQFHQNKLQNITVETEYFNNGQISQIRRFKNGKKHGDWYQYNENGILQEIKIYRLGKLHDIY